jgi:dUTP pyrophosphatase
VVETGFAVEVPPGYELQVRPRSGLAAKYGITVVNSPGTIDEDYRGEIKVILLNQGLRRVHLCRGDRIAQLVLAPVIRPLIVEVNTLSETVRGANGFGSTGQ